MFQGSIVALVTPMAPDGSIDESALSNLIEFHIQQKTDGLVIMGTTGESATLDTDEHCWVIQRAVELAKGRIPVIGGTGSNSTKEAIELTERAKEVGVAGCLLVTPYYNKPTQEGLYRHFMTIADMVGIPQILYNVPGRTGCDMLPETVARLAPHPHIVGIKEATGKVERVSQLRAGCGKEFLLLSGDDATAMEFIFAGGNGVISVTGNVAPKAMHEMCQFAQSGNRPEAEAINHRLDPLHKHLFIESNPIPVKWAVEQMGLIPSGIRLPLTPLSASCHETVRQAMQHAGVL